MKQIDSNMGHSEINEYDIHDMLAGRIFVDSELANLHKVTVVAEEPDFPAAKWEKKINDLLTTLDDLDCELHDDAEYTCR